tara:strand:- start:377 stop:1612 length:1236 start_codon:yes stop_codon:yes gene_type:complete
MVFRYLNRPRGGSSSSAFYDFSLGSLPAGVTLTRASSGYRYNSSGVLVSETTNVARFDYAPVALTARGLLIEGAATNNAQRSEEIDNAYWTKTRATVTANGAVAPDGTTTMDQVVEDTSTNSHFVSITPAFNSGTAYAISFYAKAAGRNFVLLQLPSSGFVTTRDNYFNLGTGALGTAGAGCTNFIQNVGGGIYRCTVIATATATTAAGLTVFAAATADGTASYTGDGASGFYLWGVTVVADTFPFLTSYIQTTSAAATRAVDVALITNASAISDQCWIIRGRTPRSPSFGPGKVIFVIDDGTNANTRSVYYYNQRFYVQATVANVLNCNIDLGAYAVDTDFTISVRWADNNFAASLNGGPIVTDLIGTNPIGLTTARLGRSVSGDYWNSTIKTIETRRTATNAELPLLSA